MINEFRGFHFFLSNFYIINVPYAGRVWRSSEHAFQAAKTDNEEWKDKIAKASSPNTAKHLGWEAPMKVFWDINKDRVMEEIVRNKFTHSPDLARKLRATHPHELVEGNNWGDTYWGMCNGEGLNKLGKILMKIRDELLNIQQAIQIS